MTPDEVSAIVSRLERLKEELSFIERNKPKTYEEFINDPVKRRSLERSLEIALETILDIGRLIIGFKNLQKPTDNTGIFNILAQHDIFSKEFGQRIKGIGGMRNVLVHEYMVIDFKKVYAMLDKIDDLKRCAAYMAKVLQ